MGTLWCKETEKSCITPMKSQRREIPKFASEKMKLNEWNKTVIYMFLIHLVNEIVGTFSTEGTV